MTDEFDNQINYQNNPLHGLSLKNLLIEIVDHYGFEILFAYMNINCFKTNPSIESSVKFLKKTDWAREKVEAFFLYQYKSLPKASSSQFSLPPRDRIVPEGQTSGEPAELSLEDAERLREEREQKATEYNRGGGSRARTDSGSGQSYGGQRTTLYGNRDRHRTRSSEHDSPRAQEPSSGAIDPWAKSRNKP